MDKRRILGWGLVLIVLMGILAGGLKTIEFREGRELPKWEAPGESRIVGRLPYRWIDRLLDVLPWLFLGLLVLALLYPRLFLRELGLRLVAGLLALALIIGLAAGLNLLLSKDELREEEEPPTPIAVDSPPTESPVAPAEKDLPKTVETLPWWVEYLLALAVAVPLVLIGWKIARRFFSSQAFEKSSEREELAAAVREAIGDLQAGLPVEEVVIRCWARMTEILVGRAGGSPAITPRELAQLLAKRGMRHEAITELTRLFEEVRYGGKADLPRRERAIAALAMIEKAYGSAPA